MAKVALAIYKSGAVAIKIAHKGKEARINTGISGNVAKWNGQGFTNGSPTINAQLRDIEETARLALLEVKRTRDISKLTAVQLRDAINAQTNKTPLGDFLSHFRKFITTKEKPSTNSIYLATFRHLERYCGGGFPSFDDITPAFLLGFSDYLAKNGCPSVNGRAIHLRNIRAVINNAITLGLASGYPFRAFKIKHTETPSRALSLAQLEAYFCAQLSGKAKEAQIIFAFSFYLAGINLADIFALTPENISGGRLRYQRQKTGKYYDIPITPPVARIIETNKGTEKLLSICERYKSAHTFTIGVNLGLRSHGVKGVPSLTSYFARHTWATIAVNDCGIGLDVVARVLGHSYGYRVTQIYARYNTTAIDNAVREVANKLSFSFSTEAQQ